MSPLSPAAVDPPPTKNPRGNPSLALVPRCGARTRGGCACRAPAIHGKLRCRMHGGRSTGPRTPEGFARLRAARTSHDNVAAEARALDRWRFTLLRRARVDMAAQRYQAHLPPAFVARLYCHPPELTAPPKPTGGITTVQDRVRRRAVAAGLAPWQQAIAAARVAERAERAAARVAKAHAPVGGRPPRGAGVPGPHAPIPGDAALAAAARLAKPGAPVGACSPRDAGVPGPYAPIPGAAGPAAGTGCALGSKRMAGPTPGTSARGQGLPAMTGGGAGVPGPYAPIPGDACGGKPRTPIPGPATPAMPPGLPNRAARRRWKRQQRLLRRASAAGTSA